MLWPLSKPVLWHSHIWCILVLLICRFDLNLYQYISSSFYITLHFCQIKESTTNKRPKYANFHPESQPQCSLKKQYRKKMMVIFFPSTPLCVYMIMQLHFLFEISFIQGGTSRTTLIRNIIGLYSMKCCTEIFQNISY